MRFNLFYLIIFIAVFNSCEKDNSDTDVTPEELSISYVYVGQTALTLNGDNKNIATTEMVEIKFDKAIDINSAKENIQLLDNKNQLVRVSFSFFNNNTLAKIASVGLEENTTYTLIISGNLIGENGETFKEKVYTFTTLTQPLILKSIEIDGVEINPNQRIQNTSREPNINLYFNSQVRVEDLMAYSTFMIKSIPVNYNLEQVNDSTVLFSTNQVLEACKNHQFSISSSIENQIGKSFDGLELSFYTELDSTLKFPEITDEELLTKIQQQTFKYFWDFGHPVSGLTRERNTSGETVTSGGSGFGLMAIVIGIERGFITRAEGLERLQTIVEFLATADRFHGAWSHWLNGTTGKTIPFGDIDDGGDLVETSFMAAGLLTVRQYLNPSIPEENTLISKINSLWNTIEWDWYTKNGEKVLYWHWSPNFEWQVNMPIHGYNEALITYIMAASSETYSIDADVYHHGWANNGDMVNGSQYQGYELPLGESYGGPMFFAHYSFLGIDPRNLNDTYANYWEQNRNHSHINRAHCIENPNQFVSYSAECWGLTASDNHEGYSAHSPTNDLGVISPTAAVSSIPYTPNESLDAIRFFYYVLGDKLWGEYGFYDAFNFSEDWIASSYLAIDQGPIIIMIENYRTGLIWDLLMSCPEIQSGLTKLSFTY